MMISVVIPAYNEEKNIKHLVEDTSLVLKENRYRGNIIVVNDCSTDDTLKICKNLKKKIKNLKIITHKKRVGKTKSILSGLDAVKTDYMITIDADYQYDPRDIPKIVNKLKEGYKLVSGWRVERKDPLIRLIFSFFFNLIDRTLFGIDLHDVNCGLKGYSTEMLKNINFNFSNFFIDTELLAKVYKKGIKASEVKVNHLPRKGDTSKLNVIKISVETIVNCIKLKFMLWRGEC